MGVRGSWQLVTALMLVPILAGVLPILVAYGLISSSQDAALGQIESRTIQHNLVTAINTLREREVTLRHTAEDYGVWTLMDQAMLRSDRAWVSGQVGADVVQTYGIDTILILDRANRPFLVVGSPLPVSLLPPRLLSAAAGTTAVVNSTATILVAGSPIRMEQDPARRGGTIIFADRLGTEELQGIATITGSPVAVVSSEGKVVASSTPLSSAIPWHQLLRGTAASPHIQRSGAWGIIAQPLIPGAKGGPLLVLLESRAPILAAGHDLQVRGVMALALALVLAVAGGLVLSRYLLGSIFRLSHAMRTAAAAMDGGQLPTARVGALGELAHSFNTLSASLEVMVQARTEIALRDSLLSNREREMAKLRETEQARRDFMANTSHELRTPLTVIQGYLEMLEGNYQRMTDAQRLTAVRKAVKGGQRLAHLVEDIFLMMRLEEGGVRISAAAYDLSELLREVALDLPLVYPGQQIAVEIAREPLAIHSDRDRLRQILVNLLDNAAKYSPEGAPITVSLTEESGNLRLAVRDQGPGITPELRERLFQRFAKAGTVARAGRVGTGLGLAISKALATKLGGWIELESEVGEGSTFVLVLPLAAVSSSAIEIQVIEGERAAVGA